MKNEFKIKLINYIKDSDLNLEKKRLWQLFLCLSLPEEDEAVFEAISESKANLVLLTGHLEGKIDDMKKNNQQVLSMLKSNKLCAQFLD